MFAGLHLAQITAGLLGVLAITSEYSTGMIRATLAAVPQRRLLLAAKALVLTTVVAATAIASCFAAYLVFQAFLPNTLLTAEAVIQTEHPERYLARLGTHAAKMHQHLGRRRERLTVTWQQAATPGAEPGPGG